MSVQNLLINRLVKVLRSDKYKQGSGRLSQHDSEFSFRHCCLGVACEVYMDIQREYPELNLPPVEKKTSVAGTGLVAFGGSCHCLPETIRRTYGFMSESGGTFCCDECGTLSGSTTMIGLNDNLGFSFSRIADVVEKRPAGMFYSAEHPKDSLVDWAKEPELVN